MYYQKNTQRLHFHYLKEYLENLPEKKLDVLSTENFYKPPWNSKCTTTKNC
jgi:hypothetical protein